MSDDEPQGQTPEQIHEEICQTFGWEPSYPAKDDKGTYSKCKSCGIKIYYK